MIDYCDCGGKLKAITDHENTKIGSYPSYEEWIYFKCSKCGQLWLLDYQFDAGSGTDEKWVKVDDIG